MVNSMDRLIQYLLLGSFNLHAIASKKMSRILDKSFTNSLTKFSLGENMPQLPITALH